MGLKTIFAICMLNTFSAISLADELTDIEVIVTTATRTTSDWKTLSGNTSVIDKNQITIHNAQHLNQLLGSAANVWLSRGNGQESLLAMRSPVLTGSGSCAEFMTLADGIALRAAGFCNVNQLFDTHFEVASKIEAVKGNNSARYGSNAIFGVIDVFGIEHSDPSTLSLQLGANDYAQLSGQTHFSTPELDTSLALTLSHDGGFQESSGYSQQKFSLLSSHLLGRFNTRHRIHYSNLAQQSAGYLQLGQDAYKDKSLLKLNQFPDAYRNATAFTYQMQNYVAQSHGQLRITPYVRVNEMDFSMHFLPGTPIERNGHHSAGVLVAKQQALTESLLLNVGLDSEYTNGFLQQSQAAPLTTGSAFLQAVLPQGKHYDFSVKAYNVALYSELFSELSESTRLSLAARYDVTRYDYQNHMRSGNTRDDGSECGFSGCRYTRPDNSQDTFSKPSFSLGINHQLSPSVYAYAKLDSSFRAPHTNEMYRLQNNQQRADIKSVNAQQQEMGVKIINDFLVSELSVFSLKKRDGIYQDQTRQYLNGLTSSHRGVELDLQLVLSDTLSLRSNASYSIHKYRSNPANSDIDIIGNEIDTAPRWIASNQLNYAASDNLSLQLSINHLGSYFLDSENAHRYAGHTLANFSGQWQFTDALVGSININNLFDKRYAERADHAFGQYRYFIGQPRSLLLKLSYQFN